MTREALASHSPIRCTTCASVEIGRYLRASVGEVLRCASCKAVFLSPRSAAVSAAESLYSDDYFTEREAYFFHDGLADAGGKQSAHVADFRAGLDLIETLAPAPGELLDVGCATGSFLILAQERGFACRGLEVSSFAAERARQVSGCDVFCGTLEEAPYRDATFDVITMWDLLEHLPVPLDGLERAHRLLKPGGVLLVNTPNEDSLLRKLARLLYRGSGGVITGPIDRLYHNYHLYYFASEALTALFGRAGLEIVVMRTKPIPFSRGRISKATRMILTALSAAERMMHAEYEIIVLARRPATSPPMGEASRAATKNFNA